MLSLKNCFPKGTSLVTFPPESVKKNVPSVRKKMCLEEEEEEEEGGGGRRQP